MLVIITKGIDKKYVKNPNKNKNREDCQEKVISWSNNGDLKIEKNSKIYVNAINNHQKESMLEFIKN